MPSIDWRLRDAMPHLRDSGRLNVLLALILRANVRNRCWPSMETLCRDTGYAMEAVNEAKKWLIKQGAIEMVDYKHRVGAERQLPPRQGVYQLTGNLAIAGQVYPYLYISPTEISDSEVSPIEISTSEREVVTSFKSKQSSKTKKKKEELPSAPAIAAQSAPDNVPVVVPFNGKTENPARAENLEMGEADVTTPTPQPPSQAAPEMDKTPRDIVETPAKGKGKAAQSSAAAALAEAMGMTPVGKDWTVFGRVAKDLIGGGIGIEEFPAYVAHWKEKAAAGRWTFTTTSLTGGTRMSEYVKERAGIQEAARKQKELEDRIYAKFPHARPTSEPTEYMAEDDVRRAMDLVLKPQTRQENVS